MTYILLGSLLFVSLVAGIAIYKYDQAIQELTEIKAQSTVLFGDNKETMIYRHKDKDVSISVTRLKAILDAECEDRLIVVSRRRVSVTPDLGFSSQDY